jgi:hypothetical protein
MGLDLVEYVMAVEDAFEVAIPNEDAVGLVTPGQVVDYLCRRLGLSADGPPLVQTAFYRVRAELSHELQLPRSSIGPRTELATITTRPEKDVWAAVADRIGVERKVLTHAPKWGWVVKMIKPAPRSIGAVAEQLAMLRPAAIKPRTRSWTRDQITEVVLKLLGHQNAMSTSGADLRREFIRDLGMG